MKRCAQSLENVVDKGHNTSIDSDNISSTLTYAFHDEFNFEKYGMLEWLDELNDQSTQTFINKFSKQENKKPSKKLRYSFINSLEIEKANNYISDNNSDKRLYKLKKYENKWTIVPRECAIKSIVKQYSDTLSSLKGLTLHHYLGVSNDLDNDVISDNDVDNWLISYEEMIKIQLKKLPMFKNFCETLHPKGKMHNTFETHRQYTIQEPDQLPIAGLDFTTNSGNDQLKINLLGIDPNNQKSGLGTILLHFAVDICSLYGYTELTLESVKRAIRFYLANGFYFEIECENNDKAIEERIASLDNEGAHMILDLMDDVAISKLDKCHVKTFNSIPQTFPSCISERIYWVTEKSSFLNSILATLNKLRNADKPNETILKIINEKIETLAKDVCIPQAFFEEFQLIQPCTHYFKKIKK